MEVMLWDSLGAFQDRSVSLSCWLCKMISVLGKDHTKLLQDSFSSNHALMRSSVLARSIVDTTRSFLSSDEKICSVDIASQASDINCWSPFSVLGTDHCTGTKQRLGSCASMSLRGGDM